jgi:hypothetical protein
MAPHAVRDDPQADFWLRKQAILVHLAHFADVGGRSGLENEWAGHRVIFPWLSNTATAISAGE